MKALIIFCGAIWGAVGAGCARGHDAPPSDGGTAADGSGFQDSGVDPGALLPTTTETFTASDEVFSNPERGFYRAINLVGATDVSSAIVDGNTLFQSTIHLDSYRSSDIPSSFIDAAQTGFDQARAAGVKIVLRFAYNDAPDADASLAWVQQHLQEFGPFLRANSDVIAVMQAGFIGAWGEWHSSTNNLATPQDEEAVLDAILAQLPSDRMVQVRTPMAKAAIYGDQPLTAATAWATTAVARIGHHNDCFLASDTDMGTYPSNDIDAWKTFVADDTLYTPMGGETCAVSSRSDCATAVAEMERLHYTYINAGYNPDVVAGWTTGGCLDTINRRLGYRLVLVDAELPTALVPGQSFRALVRLRNDGFAPPINPRPVVVELVQGTRRIPFVFDNVDPRQWLPTEVITLEQVVTIPADLGPGPVSIVLALRDAAPSLATDPRYSIRTANEATWDAASGTNVLRVLP
jgi:hypothetical protein